MKKGSQRRIAARTFFKRKVKANMEQESIFSMVQSVVNFAREASAQSTHTHTTWNSVWMCSSFQAIESFLLDCSDTFYLGSVSQYAPASTDALRTNVLPYTRPVPETSLINIRVINKHFPSAKIGSDPENRLKRAHRRKNFPRAWNVRSWNYALLDFVSISRKCF